MIIEKWRHFGGAAVMAWALTWSRPANATSCYDEPVITGQTCNVTEDCNEDCSENGCGPVECDPPVVTCQYQYGQKQICTVPVWRFFNGSHHVYSLSSAAPAGYSFDGYAFSLAPSSGGGGVAFPSLLGGTDYYYPNGACCSQFSGLLTLDAFYNPGTGDFLYTTNPSDAAKYACLPAGCNYNAATGVCVGYPPNCYMTLGSVGLVGP